MLLLSLLWVGESAPEGGDGGDGATGFHDTPPGLGRGGGGTLAGTEAAGFSNAAILSRREPSFLGGVRWSAMRVRERERRGPEYHQRLLSHASTSPHYPFIQRTNSTHS